MSNGQLDCAGKPLVLKHICLAVAMIALAGCQTSLSAGHVRDGSSPERAVVLKATSDSENVSAEYAWIREHVPGAKPSMQELIMDRGHEFDALTLDLPDGKSAVYFFDITAGYGKFF